MLVPQMEKNWEVIEYFNKKNINVVLFVLLSQQYLYGPEMKKRGGSGLVHDVAPLSELDLSRFEDVFLKFLVGVEARKLKLAAVQIGNEFNSADFNGDLPLIQGGAVLSAKTYREYSFWSKFEGGLNKLVEAVRFTRTALNETSQTRGTPVILGGLARPSNEWLSQVNASLVEPGVALRTLRELGIDRYVDAYAVHIYPRLTEPVDDAGGAIASQVTSILNEARDGIDKSKPWWITEWGFPKSFARANGSNSRLGYYLSFLSILSQHWSEVVQASFIFDWNESKVYGVWDGGSVLGTDGFFAHQEGSRFPPTIKQQSPSNP
ncbi:hypothetical protein [Microvirga sp. TS319]|uniref:hypothetical protein n=1 Tax=Microvirga sp. TS319 TaxID=3241165 RepID=UPI00351A8ACB